MFKIKKHKLVLFLITPSFAQFIVVYFICFLITSFFAWFYLKNWTDSQDKVLKTTVLASGNNSANNNSKLIPRVLDGVLVSEKEAFNWPVAIMLDNLSLARPHSGLFQAQLVYETLVESGITRLMAVYSNISSLGDLKIGPVRSARHYFLEWVSEIDALYVHAGGSPQALAVIDGLKIKDLNALYQGQYFWRDRSRYAPHNLYTSAQKLTYALRDRDLLDKKINFRSWHFKDDKPFSERSKEEKIILIDFSAGTSYDVKWQYVPEENVYLRFNGPEQPHQDKETGQQIKVKNVIVQKVPPEIFLGEKGRIDLNLHGEGEALIFRDGEVILGKWVKKDRLSRTLFYDKEGKEIELNRGKIWIEIIPGKRSIEY